MQLVLASFGPVLLLLVSRQLQAAMAQSPVLGLATSSQCSSEQQVIMCGQIPLTQQFRSEWLTCCRLHRPVALWAAAQQSLSTAAEQQQVATAQTARGDLNGDLDYPPNYWFGKCTDQQAASVPVFVPNLVKVVSYPVPQLLRGVIQRVKAKVLAGIAEPVRKEHNRLRTFSGSSGFQHPAGTAGPLELALMKYRLNTGHAVTLTAKESLLTGRGVRPKIRQNPDGSSFAPPVDCPAEGYYGPLPMSGVQIKWSGISLPGSPCPSNYPPSAPDLYCGHISLVELDGQMSYKMALAWHVTGDERYANKVFDICDAWARTNKEWGVRGENGPLEAGWAIASMARALELLRPAAAPAGVISRFVTWVNALPMKDMDWYVDLQSNKGITNFYGNWHSSIAECFMAMGILSDDRARYDKGVRLYHATVADYLKWGKGSYAAGRILGETSETMRDMYHAQFGLGGLLQAAEMAWQQDDDIYSSSGYALAAAMELHARVTNANLDNNMAAMPPGFKLYSAMPTPPAGAIWRFDIRKQLWQAFRTSDGAWVSDLRDGVRYMLGIGFLPTGWEVGYNHFVGRLGMQLPETAKLLARSWPEWQEFHWGLGTLTHAHSAQVLWRDGIKDYTLCEARQKPNAVQQEAAAGPGFNSRPDGITDYVDVFAQLADLYAANNTAVTAESSSDVTASSA